MRSSCFQLPMRSARRVRGTFLLALPLCGLAFYSPAQAQPEIAPPKVAPSPLSAQEKAAVDQTLSIAKYEELCKSRLDLELKDATLADVIKAVQDSFPGQKIVVNVRDANSIRVSFLLKQTRVGDIMQAVAALSGCEFWVFEDGLLIARRSMLLKGEEDAVKEMKSGQWLKSTQAGGSGWSNQSRATQIFAQAIAHEITAGNGARAAKTTFGTFSPESQAMLQALGTWGREGHRANHPEQPPFILSADSPVVVNTTDPKSITIKMSGGASDPEVGEIQYSINIQ